MRHGLNRPEPEPAAHIQRIASASMRCAAAAFRVPAHIGRAIYRRKALPVSAWSTVAVNSCR